MAKWGASQKRLFAHFNFNLYKDFKNNEGQIKNVAGFDIGKGNFGYAVVNNKNDELVDYGVISSSAKYGPKYKRLQKIYKELKDVFRRNLFKVYSFEAVRVKKQVGGFQDLSEALATLRLFRAWEIPNSFCFSVTPTSLKKIATGSGKSDKKEVISSIKNKFGVDSISDDAADAATAAYVQAKFDTVASAYCRAARGKSDADMYDFLLDVFKRRHNIFESLIGDSVDDNVVDAILGLCSGKGGLKMLQRNDTELYYHARDRAKELY